VLKKALNQCQNLAGLSSQTDWSVIVVWINIFRKHGVAYYTSMLFHVLENVTCCEWPLNKHSSQVYLVVLNVIRCQKYDGCDVGYWYKYVIVSDSMNIVFTVSIGWGTKSRFHFHQRSMHLWQWCRYILMLWAEYWWNIFHIRVLVSGSVVIGHVVDLTLIIRRFCSDGDTVVVRTYQLHVTDVKIALNTC